MIASSRFNNMHENILIATFNAYNQFFIRCWPIYDKRNNLIPVLAETNAYFFAIILNSTGANVTKMSVCKLRKKNFRSHFRYFYVKSCKIYTLFEDVAKLFSQFETYLGFNRHPTELLQGPSR